MYSTSTQTAIGHGCVTRVGKGKGERRGGIDRRNMGGEGNKGKEGRRIGEGEGTSVAS